MAEVTEILYETFKSGKQKWMVLVGDGKTYDHLSKVKRLYGSTLQDILIFPGDWHVLKNFQPVLMKAYFHAGLKEIASASGYRAETLKSIERCSHFKRTHQFLVQVWEALYTSIISAFISVNPEFSNLEMQLQSTIS